MSEYRCPYCSEQSLFKDGTFNYPTSQTFIKCFTCKRIIRMMSFDVETGETQVFDYKEPEAR